MGGPFSLRCLSPLGSPAVGTGQTQPMRVGMLRRRLDGFAVSINRPVSQLTAGGRLAQPAQHVFFCNSKGQHGFETKLAFLASHEARRRAAVKPRPTCFPSSTPAPYGARCGVQGGERKRVSSGHNRRRRLATGSRQPKRGFDTAVSKTTIEVADHYPCQGDALDPFRVPWVQLLRLSPRENYRPSL